MRRSFTLFGKEECKYVASQIVDILVEQSDFLRDAMRYSFFIAVFFGLLCIVPEQIDRLAERSPVVKVLRQYQLIIGYLCTLVGMMVFHASLRKFTLRYQFHQLCWLLCTLLAVARFFLHIGKFIQNRLCLMF